LGALVSCDSWRDTIPEAEEMALRGCSRDWLFFLLIRSGRHMSKAVVGLGYARSQAEGRDANSL